MNPFVFLIETVFYFYTLLLMLRLLLQWVRADFYNPLSQFVVRATNPVVKPLRRIIPGLGGIDLASLLLVIGLTAIKIVVVTWIMDIPVNPLSLLLTSLMETFVLLLDIFLFSIFILAIMSWINPDPYHPAAALLSNLTRPVMRPLRKYIPPIGGIDITPMIAIIIILFIKQSLNYFF